MPVLYIKNWQKWQTMQHGRPAPWIKLYRHLITDRNFRKLTHSERGILLQLWLICDVNSGEVDIDPVYLRDILGSTSGIKINNVINKIKELGFLTPEPLRHREEKRREEKREADNKVIHKTQKPPAQNIGTLLQGSTTNAKPGESMQEYLARMKIPTKQ